MNVKFGFIGCGKMASAIIKGISGNKNTLIKGSEINPEIASESQKRLNIPVLSDNKALVIDSDIIFIAIKPNQVSDVLDEIKQEITQDKLIVSIAAGVNTKKIENIIGKQRIIRVMPNTPALVKEGMFGVCKGRYANNDDTQTVLSLLSSIGKCIEVTEEQMDIVTAISGSGPAFFYKVIEDMARAGEKLGLDYDKSLLLATQTALGSAKMVFNRGETPVQTLIDNVATKGGCTFEGIQVMNNQNSAKLFYDVIDKTTTKANLLGK
ncbi:MAG: pyrroline-5-carboxylate reductase [Candidatus Gastranaerophilaceae bacterium]|nr:pyrroline-5-carboxylate reductase [Candidatus Gastranaerophilaceae bacterium]